MPGPEKIAEHILRKYLEGLDWWTFKLHGSTYQRGLPDLLLHPPIPKDALSGIAKGFMLAEVKCLQSQPRDMFAGDLTVKLLSCFQIANWILANEHNAPLCIVANLSFRKTEDWFVIKPLRFMPVNATVHCVNLSDLESELLFW